MSTSIFHPIPKNIIDFKLLIVRCARVASKKRTPYDNEAWFCNANDDLQVRWHYKKKLAVIRFDNERFKQGHIVLWMDMKSKSFLYSITNTWASGFGADAWNEQLSELDLKTILKSSSNSNCSRRLRSVFYNKIPLQI